jgi:hypothetical protein
MPFDIFVFSTANPVGGAIGQLLSPLPGNTRHSVRLSFKPVIGTGSLTNTPCPAYVKILILAIISTASIPFVFLIGEAPPVPPSRSHPFLCTHFLSLTLLSNSVLWFEENTFFTFSPPRPARLTHVLLRYGRVYDHPRTRGLLYHYACVWSTRGKVRS